MHINKFKKIGKNKYKLFLDTTDITLYEDIILKYNLLIKNDISIEEIDKMVEENSYFDAYNIALNYLETRLRNKKEIIAYLNKKGFDSKYIDYALEKLDHLNLLDEKKYVEAYVNDRILLSLDGPYKIKKYLLDCDINQEIIDSYIGIIDDETWKERILKIIEKKKSLMKSKSYYMFINKLKNDIYNLGYDKYMIDELLCNVEYSSDALSKDFEKSLRKFNGDKNKIISSLIRKGYNYDEILKCF